MMQIGIENNINTCEADEERKRVSVEFSRAAVDWVLKSRNERDNITYKQEALSDITKHIYYGKFPSLNLSEYIIKSIPNNIAGKPKPSKDYLLAKNITRFE